MQKRTIFEILVIALLGAISIMGWTRHTAESAAVQAASPAAAIASEQPAGTTTAMQTQPCVGTTAPVAGSAGTRATTTSNVQPSQPHYYSQTTAHQGRSTGKSVALVAGSAGAGAAIGALAGGGKGAGIGALAGGGAGLVYDRLTHKTHTGL